MSRENSYQVIQLMQTIACHVLHPDSWRGLHGRIITTILQSYTG